MQKRLVVLVMALVFSRVGSSNTEFELSDANKLSPKKLTTMFSGKIRTCEPDSRNFVFKFFKNGKVDAKNDGGGDTGDWEIDSDGKLCVSYDSRWRDWCRHFYLSPTNPNQVGCEGTTTGTFYTRTLKPIE